MAELLLLNEEWIGVEHMHTGLPKSDESLNASIQILFHVPQFLRVLPDLKAHKCQVPVCVCCNILNLWQSFKQGNVKVELISDLSPLLQGDSFEKLMAIISALHFYLTVPEHRTKGSCILEVFAGEMVTTNVCSSCLESKSLSEQLVALQVSLSVGDNLQHAIDVSFTTKSSQYNCKTCGVCASTVSKTFKKIPRVLIVHLVRRQYTKSFYFNPIIKLPRGEEYKVIGAIKNETFAIVRCPNDSLVSIQNRKMKSVSWNKFEGIEMGAACNTLVYSLQVTDSSTINQAVKFQDFPKTPEKTESLTPIQEESVHSTTKWSVSKLTERDDSSASKIEKEKVTPRNLYGKASADGVLSKVGRSNQKSPKRPSHQLQQLRMGFRIYVRRIASYNTLINKPLKFEFFTGLSISNFQALFDLVGGEDSIKRLKILYTQKTPQKFNKNEMLSSKDKLLMFLIRLRRGVPLEDLSYVFGIGKSRCADLVYVMLRLLYLTFKKLEKHMFLSAEDQKKKKPAPFKPFKNLRVIIDGLEIFMDRPSNFQHQGNTYSDYKSHNTVRFIIGISCYGGIIFVSPGFEGNMSEKEALKKSGFYEYLQAGDVVMSDRGFDINNDLLRIGVDLVKPPSLDGRNKFTPEEEIATKAIAAARIYVEHAVKLIKVNRLFKPCVPLNMLPTISDYVYVAGALANFGSKSFKRSSRK